MPPAAGLIVSECWKFEMNTTVSLTVFQILQTLTKTLTSTDRRTERRTGESLRITRCRSIKCMIISLCFFIIIYANILAARLTDRWTDGW